MYKPWSRHIPETASALQNNSALQSISLHQRAINYPKERRLSVIMRDIRSRMRARNANVRIGPSRNASHCRRMKIALKDVLVVQ